MQLARLPRTIAVAAEDFVLVEPAPETRREDRLQVDRAMRHRLRCILDDDPAEVVVGLGGSHSELEDLDEVAEVPESVQVLQIVRQRVVVALRDLPQRLRAYRPLEVDVQLDLRVRHTRDGSGRRTATRRSRLQARARPSGDIREHWRN